MLKKFIVKGLLLVGASMSFGAYASDLTIENKTSKDSTSIINKGPCSTILGKEGVTRAGTTNVVHEGTLKLACLFHTKDCKADVYMTDNCKGPIVAKVVFDLKKGITEFTPLDPHFSFTFNGFFISISEAA